MNAYSYTFQTPDHSYDIVPDPLDSDTVRIQSEFKDSIEDFLDTLELAGRGDDEDFQAIDIVTEDTIKEGQNTYDTYWYTEVTKADLALYFQFEVLNFMGAVPDA
jgi:hypothetical protein